jgi:hypothetical protein
MFEKGPGQADIDEGRLGDFFNPCREPTPYLPPAIAPPVSIRRVFHLCISRWCRANTFKALDPSRGSPILLRPVKYLPQIGVTRGTERGIGDLASVIVLEDPTLDNDSARSAAASL